jgi:membrane protein DedA with SNARE-associated domain
MIVLSGHFVPWPEDISLIAAGYIVAIGYVKLWPVILIAMTAPVVGDVLLFSLSRVGSRFAPHPDKYKEWRLFKFAQHHMHNNTVLTVVLMRFVTGFRFLSPVVGSYLRVPPKKYFAANAISAAIYGPFFVFIGYHFSGQISSLITILKNIDHAVLIAVAVVICASLGVLGWKRYNTRNATK